MRDLTSKGGIRPMPTRLWQHALDERNPVTDPTHSQNSGPNAPDAPDLYGSGRHAAPAHPTDASSLFDDAHSPASPYTVVHAPVPARAFPAVEPVITSVPGPSAVPPQQVGPPHPFAPPPSFVPPPPAMPLMTFVPPTPTVVPAQQPAAVPELAAAPQPDAAPPVEYVPPPAPYAAPPQGDGPQPDADSDDEPPPPTSYRPYAQPGYGAHTPVPPPSQGPPPAYGSVDPYAGLGLPMAGAPVPGFGAARPRTENVGRGLLMALIAVIGGCVLAAAVYHLGFVASIVALAMGAAGIFLYTKGAGAPPRKGAVGLVVLLMAGILLAWICSVGTELYFFYVDQTGTSNGALAFAVGGAFSLDLFKATLKDFVIFVGFGALGIFGVARQLLLPRKRK
jgi:hypothetical protein